ncbi:MAG: hypothetical protein KJO49_06305 [Bacteroidia bacterium]|nr:hypothetical protein [Bacteroidia bacterium]NNF82602.1 hypothetical protein [Flavobacteriaceae bacterium]NNK68958.1 hypothetical protein [Flavobacteriaceae bacterium]NNL80102.1 hypothetical protein [Flavobacteriaceae bacterium]
MEVLKSKIEAWDGIHMDHLKSIYIQFLNDPEFFNNITEWSSDINLQAASTWLIKHHYDSGEELNETQIDRLIGISSELVQWEAQLHILQILPKIEFATEQLILIDDFARRCLKSENKFVRAWAYQGMFELYKYSVVDKEELRSLCEIAMETESASIKSKVRKIIANL